LFKRRSIAAVALCLATACKVDSTRSDETLFDLTGTWDAEFSGTIQGMGGRQTDSFVMELRQSGSAVTGTLLYRGTTLSVPLSGSVMGSAFSYSATATLAPGCPVTIQASATITAGGARIEGSQTQSTCEGSAVGEMSATRR
jgi:hypothetical protein